MSFAVILLFSASCLISSATTANPFPASPALAASIDAFRARRFVWLAISRIFPVSALAVLGALEEKTIEEMAQSLLEEEEKLAIEKAKKEEE